MYATTTDCLFLWLMYHSYHLILSAIRPILLYNSVWECKPPSSFHSCWAGFCNTGTLNLLTHLRYYYLISSYVNIFVTLTSFSEEIVIVIVLIIWGKATIRIKYKWSEILKILKQILNSTTRWRSPSGERHRVVVYCSTSSASQPNAEP